MSDNIPQEIEQPAAAEGAQSEPALDARVGDLLREARAMSARGGSRVEIALTAASEAPQLASDAKVS